MPLNELADCIYLRHNQQAASHLMRVACGLDSLILGEPQILGQVKQAYQMSEQYYQQRELPMSASFLAYFKKPFQRLNE
ncbi:hypothetical protein [Pasteurella canis]|uniref:hypothetical protein n=1 Tax=Pasteurella canis TaxID=753 RepID=UPI0037C9AF70